MSWILKKAAAYLIEKKQKPTGFEDLKFSGVDSDGVRYYTWDDLSLVPHNRVIKLESAALFIDARLDQNSLTTIADTIEKTSFEIYQEKDADKRRKMHAMIVSLCNELNFRQKYAIPEVWHVEMAAILNVRENENPNKVDEDLHMQKTVALGKELRNGNAFFFKSPTYRALLNLSVGDAGELQKLFLRWEADQNQQRERIEAIRSYTASSNIEKTSTS